MILSDLIINAIDRNASDLHITIGIPPVCRVNGKLENIGDTKLTADDTVSLMEPLLDEEKQKRLKERGEVDFSYAMTGIGRFRVNIFKQRGWYAMAIRLFPNEIPTPDVLGLPDSIVKLTDKKEGLIIVTGPTGCGKSTTAASLVNEINHKDRVHVITIEDPIEYLYRHDKAIVNQREIGIDTFSYDMAITAALRENADVIFVGELVEMETIAKAISAAETGHLVIALMHTVGVTNTLTRLIDIFPPYQQQLVKLQLSGVINAIVSQQLLPDIDGNGRVAAFEILRNNREVAECIKTGKLNQIERIVNSGGKNGMQSMDEAIYNLYLRKKISKETLIKYSKNPIV